MQPMEEIYRDYATVVYKYLISLTHDSDMAEELTQETFYQAIRSSDRYDESCKMTTWLCSIAKNVLITYRRKHPVTEDIHIFRRKRSFIQSSQSRAFKEDTLT